VVILAGPNGAGKSTSAPRLLRGLLTLNDFVNADTIASGLSAFAPDSAAFEAGKVMLNRIHELGRQRRSFAFETTLSSRTLRPWLVQLAADGYFVRLAYLWLPTPDLCVARVAQRVSVGGHSIPEETIRHRYDRSLHNFFHHYRPLLNHWKFYNNEDKLKLIASGAWKGETLVRDKMLWMRIKGKYG